jgi:hypothetical protein
MQRVSFVVVISACLGFGLACSAAAAADMAVKAPHRGYLKDAEQTREYAAVHEAASIVTECPLPARIRTTGATLVSSVTVSRLRSRAAPSEPPVPPRSPYAPRLQLNLLIADTLRLLDATGLVRRTRRHSLSCCRREHNSSLGHRRLGRAVAGDGWQLTRYRLVPQQGKRTKGAHSELRTLGQPSRVPKWVNQSLAELRTMSEIGGSHLAHRKPTRTTPRSKDHHSRTC